MQHAEAHSQHFLGLEQVTDVGSGIACAGRAGAALFYGALVKLILGVEEIYFSMVGVKMSVAAVSCGVDTVEEVYAPFHAL